MQTIKSILPDLFKHIDNDYQSIASPQVEQILKDLLPASTPNKNPTFTHISGIPGAGKSTYIDANFPTSFIIRFDHIMQKLPEYSELLQNGKSEEAFKMFEMKARIIGYELFSRAIDAKVDIVLEHSLNPVHLPLYKELHSLGYNTKLVFIHCTKELALERAINREKETGRHTPKKLIEERFALIDTLLPQFSSNAHKFESINYE